MTTTTTQERKDITALLGPETRKAWLVRGTLRWLIAAALVAGLVAAGVMTTRSRTNATTAVYVTEPVTRGDLDVHVSATGKLQPTNTVEVGSELSGLIVAVFVNENDSVKKGQVLARLDTSKLQDAITKSEAALTSAEARLAQTSATVKEASANLKRLRDVSRLSDGKVPSKTEMEGAEATLARAEADRSSQSASVSEARAALSSDRTNLAKASITSPIDGIVLTRAVEPGQTVAASLQVATLFKIAQDLRQMQLKVDVDEADVGQVKDGQQATFTVDAYPNRTYAADVIRVAYGSTTTADVVSYGTLLAVKNDDLSLRPGMTASAEIAAAAVKGAWLVPNAALRFTPTTASTETGRGFVGSLMPGPPPARRPQQAATRSNDIVQQLWVLRNGIPVGVPVTVGMTDGRSTEILSGNLDEGTQVITEMSGAQS
jgi:HlyD family secretion protein